MVVKKIKRYDSHDTSLWSGDSLTSWEVCLAATCDRSSLGLIWFVGRLSRKELRDLLVLWNSWFLVAASCKRFSLREFIKMTENETIDIVQALHNGAF